MIKMTTSQTKTRVPMMIMMAKLQIKRMIHSPMADFCFNFLFQFSMDKKKSKQIEISLSYWLVSMGFS